MQQPYPRRVSRGLLAMAALFLATVAFASDPTLKKFDVPADQALAAIKVFSQQAGVEVLVPTDAVAGVRTNAARGEMPPRAALEKMVTGTGLVVVQDEKSGALGLRAATKSEKNAESRPESVPAANQVKTATGMIKLETMSVLGTRIRQTETAGPSPSSSFDKEYIRATGAMTLADFLNQIPQTYGGIGVGRASAPNELNPEFGQRTETTTPPFNFVTQTSAQNIRNTQTGVSGVSLRGLGSGSTLVLVDGRRTTQSGAGNRSTDTRQGFVDLNTIPLGMVDRIEVSTDGASAIYGADAVAGVINIILKKNYTGTEITGGFKTAQHGGGRERNASIVTGFSHGKLSGTVALDYYDRQNLKASERVFAKNQDHTAIPRGTLLTDGSTLFGRNWTYNFGSPAVVQASGGTVAGTFNAIPGVRVVLVPVGSTGTPNLAQFIPVTTPAPGATIVNASAQRRLNSSAFLDLIPESKRKGLSGNLYYKVSDRLDIFTNFRASEVESHFNAQLGAHSLTGGFGSGATLPAAFNPFNQNVTINMIIPEWGSETQDVRTFDRAASAGLRGKFGQTWEWELAGSWQQQETDQISRSYNTAPFANLMIAADPALRYNPFIDYTAPGAPSQFALLDTLSLYPTLDSLSKSLGVDFTANGSLFDLRGGPLQLAFGGSSYRSEVDSTAVIFSTALIPVATTTAETGSQTTKALFAEFQVPVFGKPNGMPLFRRLDFNLAVRHEDNGRFTKSVPKISVAWVPLQPLLVRASWSEGFRAPGVTEYLTAPSVRTESVNDARRTPIVTPGVTVTQGSNPDPQAELSKNKFVGLVLEPPFAKGFNLQLNYHETVQADVLQLLSTQTIVNNEALFADRIIRAAPTAADTALNQPGAITAVSRVFVNFGRVANRSADLVVDYRLPWEQLGRFRVNVSASRTLEATRQLAPGSSPVILDDTTSAPPRLRYNTAVFWTKGDWNASGFISWMEGFTDNNAGNALVANSTTVRYFPTPAVAKLDLRVGYEFRQGLWRSYGKGLRVNVGVNNVFDKEPPFSDTIWGFNAGLHSQYMLGRSLELSFVLPL